MQEERTIQSKNISLANGIDFRFVGMTCIVSARILKTIAGSLSQKEGGYRRSTTDCQHMVF